MSGNTWVVQNTELISESETYWGCFIFCLKINTLFSRRKKNKLSKLEREGVYYSHVENQTQSHTWISHSLSLSPAPRRLPLLTCVLSPYTRPACALLPHSQHRNSSSQKSLLLNPFPVFCSRFTSSVSEGWVSKAQQLNLLSRVQFSERKTSCWRSERSFVFPWFIWCAQKQ